MRTTLTYLLLAAGAFVADASQTEADPQLACWQAAAKATATQPSLRNSMTDQQKQMEATGMFVISRTDRVLTNTTSTSALTVWPGPVQQRFTSDGASPMPVSGGNTNNLTNLACDSAQTTARAVACINGPQSPRFAPGGPPADSRVSISPNNVSVDSWVDGSDPPAAGAEMADVRLYNYQLSAAQVAALYAARVE